MHMFKCHVQGQQLVHLHFLIDGRRIHGCPDFYQGVNLSRQVKQLFRETHIRFHDGYGKPGQPVPDYFQLVDGSDEPFIIKPVSPGPARYLLNLFRVQGTFAHPVEFPGLHKHDPAYGQVQAHADGVRAYHHIGLLCQEPAHLFPPGGRGQAPIYDAAVGSLVLQMGCQGKH